MAIFPGFVSHRVVPFFQTQDHQHTRDRPADLPEPSHARPKGGGHAHGLLKLQAALLRKSAHDSLGAIGPAFKKFFCLFALCAHYLSVREFAHNLPEGPGRR